MSISPGMSVGSYRILERLGQGGMAVVYRAYQPELDRYVAVKVVSPGLGEEPGFLERFAQEAMVVAKLRHPHILNVYDYGDEDGVIYLVTQYVDGGTLADRTGAPHSADNTVRLLMPVAEALDYAHAQGVLHRDIKPANILLWRDGTPVLSDFGLAKMMESSQRLTATGMFLGTPAYMAPEQAGGVQVGPATDQYALAVVAYELLTGRVPYTADTPPALLLAHMATPLPLPRAINPALSPEIERALQKGLAKRPEDRYPTAVAFVQALLVAPENARREGRRLRRRETPTPIPSPPIVRLDVTEPVTPAVVTVAAPRPPRALPPSPPVREGRALRRLPFSPGFTAVGAAVLAFVLLVVLAEATVLRRPALTMATATTRTSLATATGTAAATPIGVPTASPPSAAPTALPPTPSAPPLPTATATVTAATAWDAALPRLDPLWGRDWPAAIGLIGQYLDAYPGYPPAQDKLYAARLAYGDQLLRAGQRPEALAQYRAAEQLLPARGEAAAAIAAVAPTATPTASPTALPTSTASPIPTVRPTATTAVVIAPAPPTAIPIVPTRPPPVIVTYPTATPIPPPRAVPPTPRPAPTGPKPGFTPTF